MKRITLFATALTVTCQLLTAAEKPPNYFATLASYTSPDSARDADYGGGAHFLFGQTLGDSWGLEYGLFASVITHESDEEHDFQYSLGVDLTYAWNRGGLSPFLLAGAGAIYDDVVREETTSPFVEAGIGIVLPIHEGGAGIRAEARYVVDINDESVPGEDQLADVRANIGMQIPFNKTAAAASPPAPVAAVSDLDSDGVRDSRDQCPNTPPGAPVGPDGCQLDSDGDGVPDSRDKCPNTPAGTEVDENGCSRDSDNDGCLDAVDQCPDTLEGMNVGKDGCALPQFTVLEGVNFEFDSDRLTANAETVLNLVTKTLKGQPNMRISINGHTDSKGSESYNQSLSGARAASVENFLIDQGIAKSRLRSRGFGESQPIASNATAPGRATNRRVELEVIK